MDDVDVWADAVAEVRRKVEEGRASGLYPEELDAQLASQFARSAKDPLRFERLAAVRDQVDRLAAVRFGRDRIGLSSSVAGGSQLHRVVGKAVSRQVAGILQQVGGYAKDVSSTMQALVAALDEQRTVITNDLFGDIDAVHHRLVALEHRLARLEAEARASRDGAGDPPSDA
jgi:hypothetical protein